MLMAELWFIEINKLTINIWGSRKGIYNMYKELDVTPSLGVLALTIQNITLTGIIFQILYNEPFTKI